MHSEVAVAVAVGFDYVHHRWVVGGGWWVVGGWVVGGEWWVPCCR